MSNKNHKYNHTFTMAPLETWIKLLWENGGIEPKYLRRIARILFRSSIAYPFRIIEKIKYGKLVAQTKIDKPPIFIIGFARSGTTHLHNLITRDPQFGVISNFQAFIPTIFLIGRNRLKKLVEKNLPSTRAMDNVKVSLDLPQEEEIAIANFCHLSVMHHLSFPKKTMEYVNKYALMEGLSNNELAQWDKALMEILQKATLDSNGKQLVLKSPSNTGRISHLLRLFPEAKFIHIVRNPYHVYSSMVNFYQKMIPIHQLHTIDADEMENNIFQSYKKIMQRYLEERSLIPSGNLIEVRYEEVEKKPIEEVERIYADLSLPNWEQAKHEITEYLKTISDYKKNPLNLEQHIINRINEEFHFALENWQYKP